MFVVVVTFGALSCGGHSQPSKTDKQLFPIYVAYSEAVAKGDLAVAKTFLPEAKSVQLDAVPPLKALAELAVLSPLSNVAEKSESVTGQNALLIVTARVGGNDATGQIRFVREDDGWRVASERWNIGADDGTQGATQERPRTAAEREAIGRLEAKGYPDPSPGQIVSAAGAGDLEAIQLFIGLGFSLDQANGDLTPLLAAIAGDHEDVALLLVQNGENIGTADDHGVTPLMSAAAKCGMTQLVKALIDKGADQRAKSSTGMTALDMARQASCSANIDLLRGPAQY